MPVFLSNNVFFKLLSQADVLSKLIFWCLIGLSVCCWWILIYKLHTLNIKLAQARYVRNRLQTVMTIEELAHIGGLIQKTIAGFLIVQVLTIVRKVIKLMQPHESARKTDRDLIKMTLDQTLKDSVQRETSYVSILRLCAEAGPLVGLFGTVWGIIQSFNRISETKVADLAAVAPGMAEALIVTFTGLFLAIPAMIGYYVVMKKIEALETELCSIADRLEWIIEGALPVVKSEWGTAYGTTTTHPQQ